MRNLGMCFLVGLILAGNVGCRRSSPFQLTKWIRDETTTTNIVRILVIDTNGNGVAGAVIGHATTCWDAGQRDLGDWERQFHGARIEISPNTEGVLSFGETNHPVQISGGDGAITISATNLAVGRIPNWRTNVYEMLSIVHPTRKIGAFVSLLPTDIGSRCTVTLDSLRVVSGRIINSDGAPLTEARTILLPLWPPPPMTLSIAEYQSTSDRYEFLLPSGDYGLLVILPGTFQPFLLSVPPSGCVLQKDIRLRKVKPLQTEPISVGDRATRTAPKK